MTTNNEIAPKPDSVRDITDDRAELEARGIEMVEIGNRYFVAQWADRSGWYEQVAFQGYWAMVFNESETFDTAEEAQAWLWSRLAGLM